METELGKDESSSWRISCSIYPYRARLPRKKKRSGYCFHRARFGAVELGLGAELGFLLSSRFPYFVPSSVCWYIFYRARFFIELGFVLVNLKERGLVPGGSMGRARVAKSKTKSRARDFYGAWWNFKLKLILTMKFGKACSIKEEMTI